MARFLNVAFLCAILCGGCADTRWLTENFDQGWWRGEFMSSTGTVGNQWPDREEDYFLLASAEYEWPVQECDDAMRCYPLFFIITRQRKDEKEDILVWAWGCLRFYPDGIKKRPTAKSAQWSCGTIIICRIMAEVNFPIGALATISATAGRYQDIPSNAGLDDENSMTDLPASAKSFPLPWGQTRVTKARFFLRVIACIGMRYR